MKIKDKANKQIMWKLPHSSYVKYLKQKPHLTSDKNHGILHSSMLNHTIRTAVLQPAWQ